MAGTKTKETRMMNGKMNKSSFKSSYLRQVEFQRKVTGAKCPGDNLPHFSYHVQAMVEEMGEVMKADKRWKTFRNTRYDKGEKLDELADVFITAINMAIHSGFSVDDVESAIENKITENYERLKQKEEES